MLALVLVALLSEPQAQAWYDTMLAEGGYGRLSRERAAFLIREDDGTLTLEPWPGGGFRHASFRGSVPPRTIAILHTHPASDPQPSSGDRREAKRVGIPILAITPAGVIAAMPDGTINAVKTPAHASGTTRGPDGPRISRRR